MAPVDKFCDNHSMVTNRSRPESQLKKCNVSICFHVVLDSSSSSNDCYPKMFIRACD